MFNRNNLPAVPNPFSGARPDGSIRQNQGYNQPPPPPRKYDQDTRMGGGYESPQRRPNPPTYESRIDNNYDDPRAYGAQSGQRGYESPHKRTSSRDQGGYRQDPNQSQASFGSRGGSGRTWTLRPAKSPNDSYTFGNL
jgi:vesicle-fusing ATPase